MLSFDLDKIRDVLILMPDKHMGNVIVAIPAILSTIKFFQKKVKGIIVDRAYKDVLLAYFNEDLIIPYDLRNCKSKLDLAIKFFNLIKRLRNLNISMAIDFEGRTTGPVISFFSGAKIRVGFESSNKSYYYNIKISPERDIHICDYYFSVPLNIGIPIYNQNFYPLTKSEWEKSLSQKLNEIKIKNTEKIICIHPGAGKIYKKYPSKYFAKIADHLTEIGYIVILIGSNKDKNDVLDVKSYIKNNVFDLCGQLSLGELMALFKISKLYIGNDSGPMHLASLFNIPIIGIFGPSDEKRWKPFGDRVITLRGTDRCNKCKGKDCNKKFECLTSLKVENVIIEADKILGALK